MPGGLGVYWLSGYCNVKEGDSGIHSLVIDRRGAPKDPVPTIKQESSLGILEHDLWNPDSSACYSTHKEVYDFDGGDDQPHPFTAPYGAERLRWPQIHLLRTLTPH